MKIKQLNNIRKQSFVTIYTSFKKQKTLLSRYGSEFNIFNFANSSGNIEVLLHLTSTNHILKTYILNRKLVRLRLKVKPVTYIHPTRYLKSLNIQNLRSLFKANQNTYTLVGVK